MNNYNYQQFGNYSNGYPEYSEDRFLIAPFLLGGVAGTALGYGIASNQGNQGNTYYPVYPMMPYYPTYYAGSTYSTYPTYSTSNNYYY